MTDDTRLTPTEANEQLDRKGLLDASQEPATYALRLATPDSAEAAARDWLAHFETVPPAGDLESIAAAERVCYVGASNTPYDRIADHARGDVRTSSFLTVFPPTEVVGVWPDASPFDRERQRALVMARNGWCVLCDGEVLVR